MVVAMCWFSRCYETRIKRVRARPSMRPCGDELLATLGCLADAAQSSDAEENRRMLQHRQTKIIAVEIIFGKSRSLGHGLIVDELGALS